jgi:hypothetical protein
MSAPPPRRSRSHFGASLCLAEAYANSCLDLCRWTCLANHASSVRLVNTVDAHISVDYVYDGGFASVCHLPPYGTCLIYFAAPSAHAAPRWTFWQSGGDSSLACYGTHMRPFRTYEIRVA